MYLFKNIKLSDYKPDTDGWRQEVINGLQTPQKTLPVKLFYDEVGSQLFDEITELPEYYPTRVEQLILDENIAEIAAILGSNCLLIELGSGSSQKTRTLLDYLPQLAGFVPIDISKEHLLQSAADVAADYPHLEVLPVCADYETSFEIPAPVQPVSRRIVYYPGSTIGNFHPAEAVAFLRHIRTVCGDQCELLIGVDLKKDRGILHRAYNDAAGVTAVFNLNILTRLNREMGAEFDLETFAHRAFYNEAAGRIEMHLVSQCDQNVRVNGRVVPFAAGETVWTESSYKYSLPEFAALAAQAGFQVASVWTDDDQLFSLQYLTRTQQ